MSNRLAPSAGVVLAGIALAAAFLPWTGSPAMTLPGVGDLWSPVGAALAGLALLAFYLRRFSVLDRNVGALAAGLASAAVLGYGVVVTVTSAREMASVGSGVALAVTTGLGGVAAAYLDGMDVESGRIRSMVRDGVVGFLVGVAGLLVGSVLGTVPIAIFPDLPRTVQYVVLTPLFGVGLGIVAFVYLRATGRGLAYLDIEMPDAEDAAYMVVGTVAIFALLVALGILSNALGLPSAESGIITEARGGNADILLVLIPLSWLVIGPGEELLFRGVIQKSLYDSYSRAGAVVVACAIFAFMHVLSYADPNLVALFSTLARLFFLSLILGVAYARTDNLTVPAVIHGTFNAVQFGLLYATLKWDISGLAILAGP